MVCIVTYRVFSESGTFSAPSNAKVRVLCIGGGGGDGYAYYGGGAGSGFLSSMEFIVEKNQNYNVRIGSGENGGNSDNQRLGTAGGDTAFSDFLIAPGGNLVNAGNSQTGGAGGSGGGGSSYDGSPVGNGGRNGANGGNG